MSKEQKLIPKMRFNEFENSDNWKQNKLGEMVNYVVDNRGKNPSYYCNEGIPIIDNFMIKNKAYPNLNEAVRYIDEYLYNNFIRKHNELNDVLITLVGNGIGNITLFPNEKSAIIQNTLGLRFNGNKKFMFYLMLAIHNEILLLNRGMAQPNIRQDELLDINIKLPDIKEQEKIGGFFTRLDKMIQLQQSKVNKVKDIKSAYLSEMFPKEGETYPKKRFEGFTEPWEEYKLKDMGRSLTGLSDKSKKDFGHGEAEFVTYMNVFNNPIAKSTQTAQVEVDENQTEVEYGDIFFTVSSETPNEVGMSSVWLYNRPNVYLNSFCFGFRPTINLNPYYMAYMLRSPEIRKRFILLAQGISRYNISKTKAMELLFPIPSNEEQEKIGHFFKNLDNQISIEEEKLAKLEKLKQAYLNDMFV